MSEEAIKIFYSYSRKDLDMRNTLEDHLSALRQANKISTWHDLELEAGTEWEPAILNKLDTADIILLLVSRNFIASEYCYGTELKRAIARHTEGTARVIPIILRPCDWNHEDVPFSKLNVLPTHAKPVTSWPDQEEAFTIVARRIRETVDQLRSKKRAARQEQEERERIQREQQLKTAEEARQRLAHKEAEQQAEQERLWREKLQAEEQERLRQAEQLRQQQALEAERLEQLKQEELERQRQEQLKRDAEKRQQQEQFKQPLSDALKGNYAQLEDFLKAGQWKEADLETAQQMCKVMGRQKELLLRVEDIEQFPCADLRAIDQLWVKHSNGKFGFSVQKKIWQQCGSPTEKNKQWEKFGERVGWRSKGLLGMGAEWKSYKNLTFYLNFRIGLAPEGHLPVGGGSAGCALGDRGWWGLFHLFSRSQTCKL